MEVYGLVGDPVDHSLSPPMHEAAYEATGLDARYVTFGVAGADLAAAVEGARALGVAGLNVTVPHKERVLDLVDPDPLAARIGAVNTVDFGDRVTGHNTDAAGARRALRAAGADLSGATAVVVGAGGAGRAVTVGLLDAGARVRVANRTVERAETLAADLQAGGAADGAASAAPGGESDALDGTVPVSAHPLSALDSLLSDATVLVNATTVGMEEDRSPVPAAALHGELTVLDAVYRPLRTRLLRDVERAGARTVDGGRMLVEQGAAAFERWTGLDAPTRAMETALYDRLE